MPQSRIFVFSRVNDGLLAAQNGLLQNISGREVLVLGATRSGADEFARLAPGPGTMGVHSMTLVQLAATLA